jgi:hypothetical protein
LSIEIQMDQCRYRSANGEIGKSRSEGICHWNENIEMKTLKWKHWNENIEMKTKQAMSTGNKPNKWKETKAKVNRKWPSEYRSEKQNINQKEYLPISWKLIKTKISRDSIYRDFYWNRRQIHLKANTILIFVSNLPKNKHTCRWQNPFDSFFSSNSWTFQLQCQSKNSLAKSSVHNVPTFTK